jgi:error-prone DNA polymerase
MTGTGANEMRTHRPQGRGEFQDGSLGIDPRNVPKGPSRRDIYVPNLHSDSIKVKTRDFR